ncbi:MAG: phage Gp37/Gp68 family protein [Rhodanobacter sp.]
MSDHSAIEWTDATWNPLRGCSRVSAGCQHCYAETVAARFSGTGMPYEGLIHPATKGWNGTVRLIPEALGQPWRWVKPRRIFVNSMSDLFHESVPFEYIAAVFFVMSVTTRHTYQVLTKRPERMLEFFKWVKDYDEGSFEDERISDVAMDMPAIKALGWNPCRGGRGGYDNCGPAWPYENVWLGVSVENQATAAERIPLLLQCPAAVRWLSCEPLLSHIDLFEHLGVWWNQAMGCFEGTSSSINASPFKGEQRISWVVAGGESGSGARPMHPDWARSLRDQCTAASVPFFFKQWGEWVPDAREYLLPLTLSDHTHCWSGHGVESYMHKVGKKCAGRKLDGVEHNTYPVMQS